MLLIADVFPVSFFKKVLAFFLALAYNHERAERSSRHKAQLNTHP